MFPIPRSLYGQGAAGTIQGTVSDSTGAVIPRANVTAINTENNLHRVTTSNETGFYAIPNLAPGTYRLEVSVAGFQKGVYSDVILAVGQQLVLNATLQVGDVSQQVTVSAEAVEAQTTASEISGSVSPTRVQELPLLSRDFRDLVSLLPGVVPMPASYTQGGVVGTTTRAYRTSISGGRSSATAYFLDGLYINPKNGMAPSGVTGGQLGIDVVREFRVLINSYTAEFGRAGSGVINMVSRSGTNSFHGSVFEFLRNDKLNARNFFDIPDKAALRRNQFGFAFGGPIQKDKTFFFLSWEALRAREGTSVVSRVPDLDARQGLLPDGRGSLVPIPNLIGARPAQAVMDLFPLPNGRNFGDGSAESIVLFNSPTRDDLANIRMDRTLTAKHSLFGRYTVNDGVRTVTRAQPNFLQISRIRNQWISLQEDWIVSPTVVNTFRTGFVRVREGRNERPAEGVKVDPGVVILPGRGDVASFTIANYSEAGQRDDSTGGGAVFNSHQFSDDLVSTKGNHTLKFGFRLERYQDNERGLQVYQTPAGPSQTSGLWTFLTLRDFFAGRAFTIRDSVGVLGNSMSQRQTLWAGYLHDEYRILGNLTLNLGLRLEYLTGPSRKPVASKMRNPFSDSGTTLGKLFYETSPVLAPRVGVAWTPFKSDQTVVVRAGGGIFYDQLEQGYYSNGINLNPPYRAQTTLAGAAFPDPYLAGNLPSRDTALAFAYPDSPDVPTVYQFSLGISKTVFRDVQMTASYVGSQGRHLTAGKQINTFPHSLVNGRTFFDKTGVKANPNYGADIIWKGVEANSYYHSLQVAVKARLRGGSSAEGSYTWAKCIDVASTENTGDFGAQREQFVYDPFNMRNNRGLCSMDIRQRLAMNFIYEFPFKNLRGFGRAILEGWSISSIMQVSDGAPISPRVSFPRSNNALNTGNSRQERPDVAPGVKLSSIVNPGNPDRYFDPRAFVLQPEGFLGNAGRNILVGPGLATVDLSVVRSFPVRENVALQFRAEFFNLSNRVNFGLPEWQVFTNTSGSPNSAAGRITNTSTTSRNMQLALKLVF